MIDSSRYKSVLSLFFTAIVSLGNAVWYEKSGFPSQNAPSGLDASQSAGWLRPARRSRILYNLLRLEGFVYVIYH